MSETSSWAGLMSTWGRLLAAVEANREDLPQVEGFRGELEASLTDLRILHARRATLQREMLVRTQELKVLAAQGRDLAVRIRDGVRARYGFRSDKLLEFGMQPIPERRSRRRHPPPDPVETKAPRNPTAP
jgi:hypothetical protein